MFKVSEKPIIVSALGAVPKSNCGIQLIHDDSRPTRKAMNDYARLEHQLKYQSLEDAVDLLFPGGYMEKIMWTPPSRGVGWPGGQTGLLLTGGVRPLPAVPTSI